jgi:hypothetical protein
MRSWGRILIACAVLAGLRPAAAADDPRGEPAVIDVRELNFDRVANLAVGKGNVTVRYKDAVLVADEARFNTQTKEIWAQGNVRVNRAGQEWVAPAAYYNFITREFKAAEIGGFVPPVYVHGFDIVRTGTNEYRVARATATTCDYERPHYRVEATRAEVYPDDRVVLQNCTLRIGDVPVFWFPAMVFGLEGDVQPFTIALGQSSRWGFYALTESHWKLNKNWAFDVLADGRTERGFAGGANIKYRYGPDILGKLHGYYANDADPRDSDDRAAGISLPTHRWRGVWEHQQFFDPTLSLTVNLNRQSDTDIVDDFFSDEFRREVEPATTFDVTRRGENYTLSVLARPQLNSFHAEVERLPEATWAVSRVRIGPAPLYYEAETRGGYYGNEGGDTGDPTFRGSAVRLDTFHQVTAPHTFWGWLTAVPRAGGRYTYYTRAPDTAAETNEVRRLVFNLGTEVSFKVSRTWSDVQNNRLGVDGIRHIVQPFADYSWVPTPDKRPGDLFQFDTERTITLGNGEVLPVTRYVPLQSPANNLVDDLDRENVVRFGLRQRLQTRRNGQPWDLVEVTGWTDYRIERFAGESDLANLFGTVVVRPVDWFAVHSFGRYEFRTGILRELNNEVRVSDADRWAVGLGTRFLEDDSHLVAGSVTAKLTRRWAAQVYQRFDMSDGQWEEQDYSLRQELHDWYVNYGFRYRSERTKDDEMAVYFSVTLKAFPSVSLGVNRVDLGAGD